MKRIYLTFVFAGAVCFQVAAQNVDEDRILSADSLIGWTFRQFVQILARSDGGR